MVHQQKVFVETVLLIEDSVIQYFRELYMFEWTNQHIYENQILKYEGTLYSAIDGKLIDVI